MCKTGTKLVIELSRGYESDPVGDLDVALTIVEEAAVQDSAGLPAGVEIADYQGPESSEAVDDGQGGSLADPTALEVARAPRARSRPEPASCTRSRSTGARPLTPA